MDNNTPSNESGMHLTGEPSSTPHEPFSKSWVAIIIVVILAVAVFAVFSYLQSANSSLDIDLTNAEEYRYYDPGVPFVFNYPNTLCWTQDIASVVIHDGSGGCGGNNAINVEGPLLLVFAFPEFEIETSEEYVKSERFQGYSPSGEHRTIGGYKALELVGDEPVLNQNVWAFLTDYTFNFEGNELDGSFGEEDIKYGVFIVSTLSELTDGQAAEDMILSTFRFEF